MNLKLFPFRSPRLAPAVLLLIATAGQAGQAGVAALDATEDILPSKTPYTLRIGPESTGPRLRCWQHGVPVADDAAAPVAPLLTAPSVTGRQMLVLANGTGLCLMMRGQPRNSVDGQK